MTIKRNINGIEVEITLTQQEMFYAYEERQHHYDVQDIDAYLGRMSEEELEENYGMSRVEVEDAYDVIAYRMRRYIDRSDDDSWCYARDNAIEDVLGIDRRMEA